MTVAATIVGAQADMQSMLSPATTTKFKERKLPCR
jgi:hypothetical protein